MEDETSMAIGYSSPEISNQSLHYSTQSSPNRRILPYSNKTSDRESLLFAKLTAMEPSVSITTQNTQYSPHGTYAQHSSNVEDSHAFEDIDDDESEVYLKYQARLHRETPSISYPHTPETLEESHDYHIDLSEIQAKADDDDEIDVHSDDETISQLSSMPRFQPAPHGNTARISQIGRAPVALLQTCSTPVSPVSPLNPFRPYGQKKRHKQLSHKVLKQSSKNGASPKVTSKKKHRFEKHVQAMENEAELVQSPPFGNVNQNKKSKHKRSSTMRLPMLQLKRTDTDQSGDGIAGPPPYFVKRGPMTPISLSIDTTLGYTVPNNPFSPKSKPQVFADGVVHHNHGTMTPSSSRCPVYVQCAQESEYEVDIAAKSNGGSHRTHSRSSSNAKLNNPFSPRSARSHRVHHEYGQTMPSNLVMSPRLLFDDVTEHETAIENEHEDVEEKAVFVDISISKATKARKSKKKKPKQTQHTRSETSSEHRASDGFVGLQSQQQAPHIKLEHIKERKPRNKHKTKKRKKKSSKSKTKTPKSKQMHTLQVRPRPSTTTARNVGAEHNQYHIVDFYEDRDDDIISFNSELY